MRQCGSMPVARGQLNHSVRFEWGLSGGLAVADGADVTVVVDVLCFTTAVVVALEREMLVLPGEPAAEDLPARARRLDAVLAEPRGSRGLTRSPSQLLRTPPVDRVLLPGVGGALVEPLGEVSTTTVAASLRNARATADWIAREHDAEDALVAVVAAGERWPEGSLRPALEDLWGAGAVLAALEDHGWEGLSPEAASAADAYRLVVGRELDHVRACVSGQELVLTGWDADVRVASEVDASGIVPLLSDRGFVPAP